MTTVNRNDLKTILLFGIHIAKVDNEFSVWEKQILARFAEAMKLSEAEKAELVNQNLSLSQGLNSLSGVEAKHLLLKTLCSVAYSDGVPHPAEVEFIEKVIVTLGDSLFILPKAEWGTYEREVLSTLSEAV